MKIIQSLMCIPLIGLPCVKAAAYIAKPDMILVRLDRNQGTKNYKISKNVLFLDRSRLDDTFRLKETWWKYANRSYLQVSSKDHPQLKLNFIYKKFHKTWMLKKTKKSKEQNYIESYFFRKNMSPTWLNSIEEVKLDRALGMVNYVFRKKEKAVWIEQDNFVVRKVAMGKASVLTTENYQMYKGGLLFPKKRKYKSPEIEVTIEVSNLAVITQQWNHSLKPNQWDISHGDVETIKQFYQNIR